MQVTNISKIGRQTVNLYLPPHNNLLPPPGRFPVPKQASLPTQPPTNSSARVRVEKPWRNNNRVTDVMPPGNTSKKATSDDAQKGRRLKNYPRHGSRFNDTTLIVDLIMDVEGTATTCYHRELLRASDVVVVVHVLFLLVRGWFQII